MHTIAPIEPIEDDIRENLKDIRLSVFKYSIFRLLCLVRKTIKTLGSWLLYLLEA
jgi:hypothetical protein